MFNLKQGENGKFFLVKKKIFGDDITSVLFKECVFKNSVSCLSVKIQ